MERSTTSLNDEDGPYVPALVRAITLHFMMGCDYCFADRNG
ncbi:hypothetical protein [Actinomyces mediterranea]|nr:hypothetical protein [Actinomyces mediterranea]